MNYFIFPGCLKLWSTPEQAFSIWACAMPADLILWLLADEWGIFKSFVHIQDSVFDKLLILYNPLIFLFVISFALQHIEGLSCLLQLLEALLPDGMTIPTGFETVGHIAHLNLRDEHQSYKKLIAQVSRNFPQISYLAIK